MNVGAKRLEHVPEVSVIVVNWNGGELLRACLASIKQFPPRVSHEVIVVDNASTDGSLEWLRAEEIHTEETRTQSGGAALRVIANPENVGFARANNQGFAASHAPLLFLLNSDAEVRSGAIDKLVETARSDENIGAVGPRLVNPDGSLQASAWRNPPTPWESLVVALRLYKLMPRRLRGELLLGYFWSHDRRRTANLLSGAALMAKRKMIEAVGGLDERFHMYGEDTEWCLRIVRGGWQLMFEPEAIVMHHGGQSSAQRWDKLEKLGVELTGYFRYMNLRLPRYHVIANLLTGCFIFLLQFPFRRLTNRPTADVALMLKMYAQELRRVLAGSLR